MKNKITFIMLCIALALSFTSCDKGNDISAGSGNKYIINYGSYSGAKSSISVIDNLSDSVINYQYLKANNVEIVSNVQYAYNFNNKIYLMGNNADQVFYINNETLVQNEDGITTNIIKPRACAGQGNYLYVSCWGGDIWVDNSISYIAKINVSTNTVEKTIALPGGPEGLAIANDKLYAALNYKDSVAVIDLNTEAISYIITPAVSTYFEQDNQGNLYVSLVSSFSMPSDVTGLGYINTKTDELEGVFGLAGISSGYVDVMAPNTDFSKLYVMTSAYDAEWNLTGAIASFDVANKSFDSEMIIDGISSLNGVGFDGTNILCFIADGVTGNGYVRSYSSSGTFIKENETGIAPFMMLTVD